MRPKHEQDIVDLMVKEALEQYTVVKFNFGMYENTGKDVQKWLNEHNITRCFIMEAINCIHFIDEQEAMIFRLGYYNGNKNPFKI